MTREQTADAIATARSTTPPRLQRRLRGDLDRIVLKALDPDPVRRYASARDLREDLERHNRGMPIVAKPATVGYRVRKFARRHRAGVSAVTVAAVLIAGFGGFHTARITRERDVARAEAEKARATTQFLQQLLGDAYPSVALGDTFSMGELLGRAVARVDSLSGQPEVQADLLRTIGDVYREQGRFDDALPLLERALSIQRQRGNPDLRAVGRALDALGHLQYERKDYDAALSAHTEALDIFTSLYEPDDSLVLFGLNNVAAAASELQDHETAIELYRTVLDRHGRLFADTSQLVHVTWNNIGQLYHTMRQYEDAERAQREAIRIRRIALPPDHPSLALTLNNQGSTLERLGRLEEAESMHREVLDVFRRVYGPDHHRVGLSAYNLARVLRQTGKLVEAEELSRLTLRIDRATYGDDHPEIGVDLRGLAGILTERGNCEEAVATLREADSIFVLNAMPLTHRRRLLARADLGACLTTLGRRQEAESVLRASLAAVQASPDEADDDGASRIAERLIQLYESWGRPAAADSIRREATARSH